MQSHGGHHVPSMNIATRDGKGIAMSCGKYWEKVKKALIKHITCPAAAERGVHYVRSEIQSVVWALRETAKAGDPVVDLTSQLKRESMNVIMQQIFSKRYGAHLPKRFLELQVSVRKKRSLPSLLSAHLILRTPHTFSRNAANAEALH